MFFPRASLLAGLALLLSLALSACDDIQHPFQPESKPLPAVLQTPNKTPTVITVEQVKGVPDDFGRALAEAMVANLRKKEVPAVFGEPADDQAIYSIGSRLLSQGDTPGSGPAIRWDVRDDHGQLVARYFQQVPVGADPLAPVTRDRLLAGLEQGPTPAMIKGIEGDAPVPSDRPAALAAATPIPAPASADPGGRSLVVTKIDGAPVKDGDIILRQAIEFALKVSQVKIATQRSPNSLTLAATIEQSQLQSGVQHVKVTWRVGRPDGKEVGQVSQENNVPSQLLKTAWGEIANAVAQNAAGGIAALVEQADAQAAAK